MIYLVYTQGHTATDETFLIRGDLGDEASWLTRHTAQLLARESEPSGLAALISFSEARRPARVDAAGDLVLLADQDRSTWDQELIAHGHVFLERALLLGRTGPFQLQAAIAATHASSLDIASPRPVGTSSSTATTGCCTCSPRR